MKNIFLTISVCAGVLCLKSQNLYDNYWIVGGSHILDLPNLSGAVFIDFSTPLPTQLPFAPNCQFGYGTSLICNNQGEPQCYSEGCCLLNAKTQLLIDGDSINYPGLAWETYCDQCSSYPNWMAGRVTLPDPASEKKYYMFHLRIGNNTFFDAQLLYSHIDMSAYAGRGAVIQKNVLLVADSLADGVTAVRHGNGRDWWIFQGTLDNNKTHLFLLDPSGVSGPFTTTTLGFRGSYDDLPGFQGHSYAAFSPTGRQFARVDGYNGVQLADFDRCTGAFSCVLNIPLKGVFASGIKDFDDSQFVNGVGLEFSPNGRFLYVSTGYRLFQFDLKSEDITNSWEIVGEYDENDPESQGIFQGELAPNDKIYWTAPGGAAMMHVIHKPDLKGKACEFVNHGFPLLVNNGFSQTIYPNFRLYDWANSPCDSLGIDDPNFGKASFYVEKLEVVPNPADQIAQIRVPHSCENPELKLFAVTGQLIMNLGHPLPNEAIEIDLNLIASGPYFVSLFSGKKAVSTVKLIVIHK